MSTYDAVITIIQKCQLLFGKVNYFVLALQKLISNVTLTKNLFFSFVPQTTTMINRDSPNNMATNSGDSPSRFIPNPQEEALQALCKRILKSRLFRGYFMERRYVDIVNGYRDVVALQRSEKDLEKVLIDICQKLYVFYQHSTTPIWFGITSGNIPGATKPAGAIDTYIWAEFNELAFGQYWFSIRNIRFREREIILKLKMVRPVESDTIETTTPLKRRRLSFTEAESASRATSTDKETSSKKSGAANNVEAGTDRDVQFQDFVDIIQQWGTSLKQNTYDFLSNDINKENIKGFLRFMGLVLISLVSFAGFSIKFLGVFILRFMFEFSRLTHVLTPLLLKVIDLFNKIIGGFYLLIAMVFRDLLINRGKPQPIYNKVEYKRPMYKSIQYNVRQYQQEEHAARIKPSDADFENKFQ